jgi:D-alanyl-D-alanine carboxypeptidase
LDIDRRTFIAGAAGVLIPGVMLAADGTSEILASLSAFIPRFMASHNTPGLTLGMADMKGWSETARFGFADLETKRPIAAGEVFHIGSISKSFCALMILQLAEEDKLKLDADVISYLPDLALKAPFGAVTIHHLLCHTAGIPNYPPIPGWPDQVVEQTFEPGSRFHYSNAGYDWLGRVIEACGGEHWSTALRRRILNPLGMTQTTTLIGAGMRHREVPSYTRREDDRPYPRMGALTRAAALTFVLPSGCIASTADDMAKYIMMIARRGQGPRGRLLTPASFSLMTKTYIKTPSFGPNAGYAYGWLTDLVDGKPVIRHPGSLESFSSSVHIDLEAGFGAFASINSLQNYGPAPVTTYAISLYRASATKGPVPKVPSVDPEADLTLTDYAGDYVHSDGRKISVSASATGLRFTVDGKSFALESLSNDQFVCLAPAYRLFTFLFTRAIPLADAIDGKPNPVVALAWARNSYVRAGARLMALAEPDKIELPPETLRSYEGLYAIGNGWVTSARVVVRDGRLWMDSFDGIIPLASLGSDRFRIADEALCPDKVPFSPASVVPRTLAVGNTVLTRIGDPFFEVE